MPAPTTIQRPMLATGRRARLIKEALDRFESKYDDRSSIDVHDLASIIYDMRELRLRTFIGRSLASFKSEYDYRMRTYFRREQRLRLSDRTHGEADVYYGGGDVPDLTGYAAQGLRFILRSLDNTYALVFDLPTATTAVTGSHTINLSVSTETAALGIGAPVPALVHFKGRSHTLPEFMLWHLSSGPDMRIRELKQYAEYVVMTYRIVGFNGIWAALERMWCELQLRQRPLTRPLSRTSVETRIRSLAGRTVWVEHTGGVAIGRCPNIGEFLDTGSVELRTAMGPAKVHPDSILEIGPWGSGYGSVFVASSSR